MAGMKLFLDDIRIPENVGFSRHEWYVARNKDDFISFILNVGIPDEISFDHDLGDDSEGWTGKTLAQWMIDYMLDNNLLLPKNFKYYVHSANPPGAENIKALMNSFILFMDSTVDRAE